MLVFSGTHINKIDKKGRVSVPAPFRAVLSKAGERQISIFPSFILKALEGFGPDLMETIAGDSYSPQDFMTKKSGPDLSRIFEKMRQVEWDAEGRVGLPEDLMAHAGIGEAVQFVGRGRSFQIWNPDTYRAHEAATNAGRSEGT
ncbi:MAG TPA: division/cell wall cluster transcriptional repressor MraZ [Magnetospirillaceae bacterium]|jgi:MraZ protein